MIDDRSAARSSVYIAGTISWDGRVQSAKIRNLSSSGALVEGPDLPPAGSSVLVARGSLCADGTVMWSTSGRCGVKFSFLVTVGEWIAPAANKQQKRIDQTIAMLKVGTTGLPAHADEAPKVAKALPSLDELASDLRELAVLIDEVGSQIMKDQDLIHRHSVTVQNVDLVAQSIDVVAGLLSSGCSEGELAERLKSLRVSRAEAMNRKWGSAISSN